MELAPRFFKAADPHKLSRRKRMERIEPLYDRCGVRSGPGAVAYPRWHLR